MDERSSELAMDQNERRKTFWKNPFAEFEGREFACGWGAAFVNITLTYPIHKIIFRQVS